MGVSSKLAWFTTESGKSFVRNCTIVLSIGSGLPYFFAHTYLLDKYKEIIQMYRHATGVPVPSNVVKLFEAVSEDLKLSRIHKSYIEPFTIFGFDLFHAGSTVTNAGAIIGFPWNLSYQSTADVDRNIKVLNKSVDWESQSGQDLQESLVLSESAKKFAIAREIAALDTFEVYLKSFFPAFIIYFLYITNTALNKKFNLFSGSLVNRLSVYLLTSIFAVALYVLLQDFTTVYYEHQSDDAATNVNESYIQGGLEFYEKTLLRNKALRALMGQEGEALYSLTGNENFLIRQTHLPTQDRKLFMKEKLEKAQKTDSNKKPDKIKYLLGVTFIDSSEKKSIANKWEESLTNETKTQ